MHGLVAYTRGVLTKRCHFLDLVMDGAAKRGAKTRMGLSVFEGKIVVVHKPELVDCESKGPGDVCRPEELGRCIGLRGEGHV